MQKLNLVKNQCEDGSGKDYSDVLQEVCIIAEKDNERIVNDICCAVLNG